MKKRASFRIPNHDLLVKMTMILSAMLVAASCTSSEEAEDESESETADAPGLEFRLSSTSGGSASRSSLSTSVGGNRYSITPDNYVILVKSIRLLKCTDSSGALTTCRPGSEGESATITSDTIYESGGIPVQMTESATSFDEALDLDGLSGTYNGIQFQLGYIQQRFPFSDIDGDGQLETERNLQGRSYRICTSPAEADLCDNGTGEAERGDYLLEESGSSSVDFVSSALFGYLYYTGCTGSSPLATTSCTGFGTHLERSSGFAAFDDHFRDMTIGGSHEWIDGYFSPVAGIDSFTDSDLAGKTLSVEFDISESFAWNDNAMSKSTCTEDGTSGEFYCSFWGADPETEVDDPANLNPGKYDVLDDLAFLPNVPQIDVTIEDASTATDSALSALPGFHERLYVGTGEFSPIDDWSGILRFEEAEAISCTATTGAVDADATIDVKTIQDADDVRLNFVHSFAVDESKDEMYLASLFTTDDNHNCDTTPPGGEICGSVGVISSASSANGAQALSRHIYGPNTTINGPHGLWVDSRRDILYVASTFNDEILVYDSASEADGDLAPDRTISTNGQCAPVFVFIDESNDRMFVACMAPATMGDAGPPTSNESIWIFNNASTLSGMPTPDIKIEGTNTRLSLGNNKTTHNVWYDPSNSILIVGHHTNEVLIYDLTTLDWEPSATPDLQNLTPRVLKINEQSDDSDEYLWSAYGLFYLPSLDRLYVSAGYAVTGDYRGSNGPPTPGTPMNAVKVYDGVSDPSFSGIETHRAIWWSSGDQYYPPQALWVTFH